jgi:DNA-binding CsgD family transcriptional regulator
MERRFHRGFTAAEKTELWDRWKRGESLKAIGRAFGKQSSSIYFLVAPHGGIRPAERRRSRLALTLAEREVISRGVTAHQSARTIAKLLGRSPSTVSREMSRNGGYDRYRATLADEMQHADWLGLLPAHINASVVFVSATDHDHWNPRSPSPGTPDHHPWNAQQL